MMKFTNDLTEGSVTKQLVRFSAPFFISNFLQALYSTVDLAMLGRFVDTPESSLGTSALYNSSAVMMFMNAAIIGLTVGGTVLIAQCVGAKRHERLKGIIGTVFSFFWLIAIGLSALLFIFSPELLGLLQTPADALPGAVDYLRISAAGFVFVVGYNAVSAVLRGMGDSVRPMIFVAAAAAANVVLDYVFVGMLGFGAAGAAYATIISQAGSFILAAVYLSRKGFVFDFKPKSFRINREELRQLLNLGFPTALQQIMVQGSFLAITPLANSIGASSVAAVMSKINGFAVLPAQAMMAAVSSMAGQNFGAGKIDRVKKVLRSAQLIILPVSLTMWAIVFFFPGTLIRTFTNYTENFAAAVKYLKFGCTEYIIVSQLFVLNGMILGAGHSMIVMFNSFVNSLLTRVPLAYLFAYALGFGMYGIPMATALAPAVGLAIAVWFYLSGRWKSGGKNGGITVDP